jgi:hypothetical protein
MPDWYGRERNASSEGGHRAAPNRQGSAPNAPTGQRPLDAEEAMYAASRDSDRLWQARQARDEGRGYYDETPSRSSAGRSTSERRRVPRQDLEQGDWYHQQMAQIRTTMPDAPDTSHYRTQTLPNIPGSMPRHRMDIDTSARLMENNRRRAQARTRKRRKKNLFAQQHRHHLWRTVVVIGVVIALIVLFVVVLATAGSYAGASAA